MISQILFCVLSAFDMPIEHLRKLSYRYLDFSNVVALGNYSFPLLCFQCPITFLA